MEYKFNERGYAIAYIYDVGDIISIHAPDDPVGFNSYYIQNLGDEEIVLKDVIPFVAEKPTKKSTYSGIKDLARKYFKLIENKSSKEPSAEEIEIIFKGKEEAEAENRMTLFWGGQKMNMHIDFYPVEECENEEVIMMCLKCNKCGRFGEDDE